MKHKVTYIAGDGIGPEIGEATKIVLAATGVDIDYDNMFAGQSAIDEGLGFALPDQTLDSIRANRVAIKGPTATPIGKGFKSANVGMRVDLDLYANIRPVRNYPGVPSRYSDLNIDMVIFREATEDIYNGVEKIIRNKEGVEVTGKITESGCYRLIQSAFQYAVRNNRKKVSIAHKANILKEYFGLFLEVGYEVAKSYPDIICDDFIIDNMCGQLVRNPDKFDVIVATNMFGDIMSDISAEVTGGLGLGPGANIGSQYAVFEAIHGTAPDIAGKGIANPCSLILSGAMMLDYLGEEEAATNVRNAVAKVLENGIYVTGDINKIKPVTTLGMVTAIAALVEDCAKIK